MSTVLLLIASNVFMTIAWYWHLKYHNVVLWQVILISWGIALIEYCLAVPANRLGHGRFTGFQLKIMQEVITLIVFIGFALIYLRESLRWNYVVAFALIFAAVYVAFMPGTRTAPVEPVSKTSLPET